MVNDRLRRSRARGQWAHLSLPLKGGTRRLWPRPLHQLLQAHPERAGEAVEGGDGRIALPAFQKADVVAVQPGAFGQRLLAEKKFAS